ncbi:hypothetical protein BS78_02G135200 [Paspalum vaginatum]|nr:hypothetical protein BS78_02G135200 [Paspalum vaginatum]
MPRRWRRLVPAAAPLRAPPHHGPPPQEAPPQGERGREQSRRVRRRGELVGNPAEGFSIARDGARRLRTHLWQAKMFSMVKWRRFILLVNPREGKS